MFGDGGGGVLVEESVAVDGGGFDGVGGCDCVGHLGRGLRNPCAGWEVTDADNGIRPSTRRPTKPAVTFLVVDLGKVVFATDVTSLPAGVKGAPAIAVWCSGSQACLTSLAVAVYLLGTEPLAGGVEPMVTWGCTSSVRATVCLTSA
jgi:hypothetical protein